MRRASRRRSRDASQRWPGPRGASRRRRDVRPGDNHSMNRPEPVAPLLSMPDVQSAPDHRELAIDHVGIRGLRYPLSIADRDGLQSTIADCSVYVHLPADRKGTHMSRLVALLEERALPGAEPLGVHNLRQLVDTLVARGRAPGGGPPLRLSFFLWN